MAISRARLGLYVLGRREVFEACPELRPAFDMLLERPDKLTLVTGELWPTERKNIDGTADTEGEVVMEGVEHLGQYVFEMTNTRIKQLQDENKMPTIDEGAEAEEEDDVREEVDEDDYDAEEYPEEEQPVEPDILEVREGES